MVHCVPVKRFIFRYGHHVVVAAISATDRAYGAEVGGRAEVSGMVQRYEVVQAVLGKV